MLGTKLRALFQREAGRDLFDLFWALTKSPTGGSRRHHRIVPVLRAARGRCSWPGRIRRLTAGTPQKSRFLRGHGAIASGRDRLRSAGGRQVRSGPSAESAASLAEPRDAVYAVPVASAQSGAWSTPRYRNARPRPITAPRRCDILQSNRQSWPSSAGPIFCPSSFGPEAIGA